MKAVFFESFGPASVLKIGNVALPELRPSEVRIKIAHTSVNPVDYKIREGYLQSMMPHEFPIISGWDAAGEVVALGSQVNSFKIGDLVYAYTRGDVVGPGTYAEYINVEQSAVALQPQSISSAQAASVPLVALTAWQSLVDVLKVKAGQTILITGGAGGVGSFAIQIAKYFGAQVITTASAKNHAYLKKLGADHILDYQRASVNDSVRKLAHDGVDLVFDGVGGESLTDAFELLKEGGILVSIVDTPSADTATRKKADARFVFVAPNGTQLREIGKLIEKGKIQIPTIETRSVKDAAAAQLASESRRTQGKIVLSIDF